MAKQAPSKKSAQNAGAGEAQKRKRALPPAEKNRRKSPDQVQPEVDPPVIDGHTKRTIAGIGCIVAAIALVLIVGWPTNAVVTSFLSNALRLGLGVGAYILPVLLVVVSGIVLLHFESNRTGTRVIIGLAVIFIAFLILMALFTPGAVGSSGTTSELFSDKQVVYRGGYIGAGPAWLGLNLLGLPVSFVIAVGIMATGFAIIGFSLRKVIEAILRKHARAEERMEEERGVAPDSPYVPAVPARISLHHNPAKAAATVAISDDYDEQYDDFDERYDDSYDEAPFDEYSEYDDFDDERLLDDDGFSDELAAIRSNSGRIASDASEEAATAPGVTQALTRRLGKQSRPIDEADNAPGGSDAGDKATRRTGDDDAEAQGRGTAVSTGGDPDGDTPGETFELPSMSLLKVSKAKGRSKALESELAETAARLQQTMEDFGIMATVVDWVAGPTVTLFEVDLPPGVRVSRIIALNDDIALALAAPGVRIFAPIPGTHYVGIEVPNAHRENVLLGDVLKYAGNNPLEIAIGKDVEGNAIVCDLAKMPHLLIGGTTGSGKSVGINAMIMSMLMRSTPSQVRFIMIDPKRVEFAPYDGIPHLYVPVVTEPKEAASALSWGVAEMERRLKVFSKIGVRNIASYNERARAGEIDEDTNPVNGKDELPYIVIIIDELADLMMNVGKEVEFSISRIAQLARAAGIHLIVATQRPSANVVTGLIKANITNRIAFNVASGLDSRVILDTSGAESLIGNGDLLLSKPEYQKPLRIQGCFTSDEEITAVVEAVKAQGEPDYHSEILNTNVMSLGDTMPDGSGGSGGADDPLIWEAAEIVVSSGLGSTSNIQRKLKVGYSRAGRIMDMLEEKGVVGPPNGSKPRDVLVDAMELETLKAFEEADG